MIKEQLRTLVRGGQLTAAETTAITEAIFAGQVSDSQLAAYLTAMSVQGPTTAALVGTVTALRQHSPACALPQPVIDIVGTGGDGFNTFNISTTVSFVVAAAGVAVAKHGNNAATSKSGAADVLAALGVPLRCHATAAQQQLAQTGQTFLYAKQCHPVLKTVAHVRSDLGFPTIFNLVGPLANPAQPEYLMLGVADAALMPLFIASFAALGIQRAVLVYGHEGMDELSISGDSTIVTYDHGATTTTTIHPHDFALATAPLAAIVGGTPSENAATTTAILNGQGTAAQENIVTLNAGVALYAAGAVTDIAAGVTRAQQVIHTGLAAHQLRDFVTSAQATGETYDS